MISYLQEIAENRQKLLDGLDANQGEISLDIFEDFYPDQAHFVYELLQNAEDVGASEATFTLLKNGCRFVHDGSRAFTEEDVRSITGIHSSTKAKSVDQIGKFGVGFKSVFVYTQSPEIRSEDLAFRIERLILPVLIQLDDDDRRKTRFWLPFDNPKKPPEVAYSEVKAGLSELTVTALLFLRNLHTVRWEIDHEVSGSIVRKQHSEHHIEIVKSTLGTTTSAHFLKFERPASGLERQHVAIAFELEPWPEERRLDGEQQLGAQFRIVPAERGKVAVYFPAQKEASGLRFHLHGPFVPELSRASIKDTPANTPLFQQLALLTADSLTQIRNLGLLTSDFLAVLPNTDDQIAYRYSDIRTQVIHRMNTQPLTPTQSRSHAPASHLVQARASLKELLSEEDLNFLMKREGKQLHWAVSAAQKNSNADRFLRGLAITGLDNNDFLSLLLGEAPGTTYKLRQFSASDSELTRWLLTKSVAWHQQLYAMLHSDFGWSTRFNRFKDLHIIRLNTGGYSIGPKCFFPSNEMKQCDALPTVDIGVYTSGKSPSQQEAAKKFLERAGVRDPGELEQIQAILDQRYTGNNLKPSKEDLKRFISFIENQPGSASIFTDFQIFEGRDGGWHVPSEIYLDEPFQATGLSAFYDLFDRDEFCLLGFTVDKLHALADYYSVCGIKLERIANFAVAVGTVTQLKPTKVSCFANPDWDYLTSVGGRRRTSPVDDDYRILGMDALLDAPSLPVSRLIWRTMQSLEQRFLKATYQLNVSGGRREADSQLVHRLRDAAWVPQVDGTFVRPEAADRSRLPAGFAYDAGWPWLKAIHFGQNAVKQTEIQRRRASLAVELGFPDDASAARALRFASLPMKDQEQLLLTFERRTNLELPEHEPVRPDRRVQRVIEQAQDSPERQFEERSRSVAVGREAVKQEAAQYLRHQYTNTDGQMICQVCEATLPFKLADGEYYFEKVEFLPALDKWHYQNYLALCPNHAAMFLHANGSRDSLLDSFRALSDSRLKIALAQEEASVYFTATHLSDLRALISTTPAAR